MNSKTAVLAVALLMAIPSTMAWTQLSGDAGRTSITHLPDGPLDVVAVIDLDDYDVVIDVALGAGVISTSEGLLTFVRNGTGLGQDCHMVTIHREGMLEFAEIQECSGKGSDGLFVGYDDLRGLAFLCIDVESPGTPFLFAIDVQTGEAAWSITPRMLMDAAPSSTQGASSDTSANDWECRGAAVDAQGGLLYVPATGYRPTSDRGDQDRGSDHRIAAVNSGDGTLEWVTFLDASVVAEQESGGDLPDLNELLDDDSVDPAAPFQRTEVDAITLTGTGLVVVGQINDASMVMTLDLDGNVVGVHQSAPSGSLVDVDTPDAAPNPAAPLTENAGNPNGNSWAVALGPLAVMGLGEQVVLIDPLSEGFLAQIDPPAFVANYHVGPTLFQDISLVPARNGIVAIDGRSLQTVWQHLASPQSDGLSMLGAVTATDGRIYTLENHPNFGMRVVLVDNQNGRATAEWPIPLNASGRLDVARTRMAAAPGIGLVILQEESSAQVAGLDNQGTQNRIILIGRHDDAPPLGLAPSTDAPASGEPITLALDVSAFENGTEVVVHWGDGTSNKHARNRTLEHIYFGAGETTITAVAKRPDGTTVSEALEIEVDGDQYSWIQEQFLPENLDMTWGVIGFGVAILGGAITLLVTSLRRRRMKREMDQLDAIRTMAVDEPILAMGRLRTYRHDLRERAKKGKLDDPPLGSILQEVSKLFHVIEQRMMTALGGRMTAGMRRAMDAAFADGVLSKNERTDLQRRLSKESKLSKGEQEDLRDLLANWV